MHQSANIRKRRLIAYNDRPNPINHDEPGPSFIKQKCYPNSIVLLNPPVRSTPSTEPLAKLLPKKRPAARLEKIKNLVALSIVSKRNQPENGQGEPKPSIDLNKFKHDPNKPVCPERSITIEPDPKMPERYQIAEVRLAKIGEVIAKTKASKQHLPEWKQKKAFTTLHRIAIEQYFHHDIVQKNEFMKQCHRRIDKLITKRLECYRRQMETERSIPVLSQSEAEESLYDSNDEGCPIEGASLNESRLNLSSQLFDAILNERVPPKPNRKSRQTRTSTRSVNKTDEPSCSHVSTPIPSSSSSSPSALPPTSSVSDTEVYPFTDLTNLDFVTIGPNGTKVRSKEFCKIPWNKPVHVVAKQLSFLVFGEKLATHTLPDVDSPPTSGQKNVLSSSKLADIVHIVTSRNKDASERSIFAAIKAKCLQQRKKQKKGQCEPKLKD